MLYLEDKVKSANESKLIYAPKVFEKYDLGKDSDNDTIHEKSNKIISKLIKDGYICEDYFRKHKISPEVTTNNIPFFSFINKKRKLVIKYIYPNRCYCLNCKEFINADIKSYKANNFWDKNVYICPKCGTSSPQEYIKNLNCKYNTFNECFIDGNKLKIKSGFLTFKEFNQHIIVKREFSIIVMNLDTGMTYLLPPLINGKINKKISIKNITYNNNWAPYLKYEKYNNNFKDIDVILNKAFNLIREYKIKKNNFYIPTIKEQFEFALKNGKSKFDLCNYKRKDSDFSYIPHKKGNENSFFFYDVNLQLENLMKLNRFPSLNIFFNNDIYSLNKSNKKALAIRTKIKQDSSNILKDFCDVLNIPLTKSLRKYYSKNILLSICYKELSNLNIKLDNILKLFNIEVSCLSRYNRLTNALINVLPSLKKFPTYNENNLINKLVNYLNKKLGNYGYLVDIFETINKILEEDEEYEIDLRKDIKDIHDTTSSDYLKLGSKNKIIEYKEDQLNINGIFNGLNFALAKDTHELIDVGSTMNICVGSYGTEAIDHDCYIVVARDDKNNPIICIEIDNDFNLLKQTKLKYNYHPTESSEEYKAILEWCHHAKMLPNNYEIKSYKTTKKYMLEHKDLVEKFNKTAYSYNKINLEEVIEDNVTGNVLQATRTLPVLN